MTLRTVSSALFALGLAGSACGQSAVSTPTSTETAMAHDEPLSCALALTEASGGELLLAFTLRSGGAAAELETFEPFLDFELAVRGASGPLSLVQPGLDIPVQPVVVVVPAGGQIKLSTPIRLAFDADPPAGGGADGFRWTLVGPRQAVTIVATLTFGELRVGPCEASFSP